MADEASQVVSINDVLELVSRIQSRGGLSRALGASPVAGCDYDCSCNHSMCGCRGSVSAHELDLVSLPEFERLRANRIKELRAQLSELERTE